jgi:hypothetical protein
MVRARAIHARTTPHDQEIIEDLVLLPFQQRHLKLELAVEMIFNDPLVAAGHEDEMLDSGRAGLVHNMLDQGPIDYRQHLLRHCLGGRQEPGAKAGDGKYSFTDGFHAIAIGPSN